MKIKLDLETLPDQREYAFERYLEQVSPPKTYKKQESIDKWMAENGESAAEELYLKTALNGLHGEICAIGCQVDDEEPQSVVRERGESEADMLRLFCNVVKKRQRMGEGDHQRIEWIGHNILDFDLRFLKQRIMVNKIPARERLFIPADARHGQGVFDTMKEWAGFRGYVSQDALCEAFGLPTKPDMTGADVWPAWNKGDYDKIREYNLYDVETVSAIHKIMVGA